MYVCLRKKDPWGCPHTDKFRSIWNSRTLLFSVGIQHPPRTVSRQSCFVFCLVLLDLLFLLVYSTIFSVLCVFLWHHYTLIKQMLQPHCLRLQVADTFLNMICLLKVEEREDFFFFSSVQTRRPSVAENRPDCTVEWHLRTCQNPFWWTSCTCPSGSQAL